MQILLTLALLTVGFGSPAFANENPAEETHLFDRVVITGASLSAGYGLQQELEADADFATIFSSAIHSDAAQVHTHASLGFFASPSSTAKRLLVDSLQEEPTLMVALDFLFWFGHGRIGDDEARMTHLKEGLALLESVGCPLVIADFPDMTVALKGVNPFGIEFIVPDMLPSEESRNEMNAVIHAWGKERKHVMVVPLALFMKRMISDQAVELRGNEWKGSQKTKILQEDLLHPTVAGNVGLTVLTLDALAQGITEFCTPCVRWSADEINTRLLEVTQKERDKNQKRARKREERRRKRDEKKRDGQESLQWSPRANEFARSF